MSPTTWWDIETKKYGVRELQHAGPQDGIIALMSQWWLSYNRLVVSFSTSKWQVSQLQDIKSEAGDLHACLTMSTMVFPFFSCCWWIKKSINIKVFVDRGWLVFFFGSWQIVWRSGLFLLNSSWQHRLLWLNGGWRCRFWWVNDTCLFWWSSCRNEVSVKNKGSEQSYIYL